MKRSSFLEHSPSNWVSYRKSAEEWIYPFQVEELERQRLDEGEVDDADDGREDNADDREHDERLPPQLVRDRSGVERKYDSWNGGDPEWIGLEIVDPDLDIILDIVVDVVPEVVADRFGVVQDDVTYLKSIKILWTLIQKAWPFLGYQFFLNGLTFPNSVIKINVGEIDTL